jgi:hypothetical protein
VTDPTTPARSPLASAARPTCDCSSLPWQISRWVTQDLGAAVTPVPTPPEIAVQLQVEWGRALCVVEVAAVHQMLTSRCTEATGMTALTYVFVRNIAEEAKGHR